MLQLPLAAGVWEWIVPLVIFAIYLLNHLLSSKAPAQQREVQRRRQAERPLRPQQQPEPAGKAQLNDEIEQFLKRANERRLEKARQAEPRQAAAPPKPKQLAPLAERATDVVPLERRDFDAVAASVEQHIGKRTFQQQVEHLDDDMAVADRQREQHYKQVFEHRLGTLGSADASSAPGTQEAKTPAPTADAPAAAKALAGLLVNQQNIRQAIVLKEILDRPVDRW
jgi:hypothetical protein